MANVPSVRLESTRIRGFVSRGEDETAIPSRRPGTPPWRVRQWLLLALACMVGVALGIGGFTFRYAEGLSYLSTDPRACVNCHIMRPEFDAWQKSSHHSVAVCVDCHLPHDFFPKYVAKAENGYRHGKMFTTGEFEEPITVKARGVEILEENCRRCHEPLVTALAATSSDPRDRISCVRCHRGAGHGDVAATGGPLRDDEKARTSP
jgi:cytochrome c nitrite reductase small subunit